MSYSTSAYVCLGFAFTASEVLDPYKATQDGESGWNVPEFTDDVDEALNGIAAALGCGWATRAGGDLPNGCDEDGNPEPENMEIALTIGEPDADVSLDFGDADVGDGFSVEAIIRLKPDLDVLAAKLRAIGLERRACVLPCIGAG